MITTEKPETPFVPKGAMAFFFAMLAGFAFIWLGMYWLLAVRQLVR